jgi:hypothetical protein
MGRSAWLRLWPVWAAPSALIVVNLLWVFGMRDIVLGRGSILARQRTTLDADVAILTGQRNVLLAALSTRDTLETDLGTLRREQLGSMRERLVSFLVDVAKRVQATGLKPERISYNAQTDRKTGLVHFAATFSVTGSYEQVRRCVNLLEGSPQFTIVEQLSLRGDEAAISLDVTVQLTVATYFAEADTGMLRELGIEDVPELTATAAPAAVGTAPAAQAQPTDFAASDARVIEDLHQAVAGLSGSTSAPDEDVFVAPVPPPSQRSRGTRTRPGADQGASSGTFLGQLGVREVSGGH